MICGTLSCLLTFPRLESPRDRALSLGQQRRSPKTCSLSAGAESLAMGGIAGHRPTAGCPLAQRGGDRGPGASWGPSHPP